MEELGLANARTSVLLVEDSTALARMLARALASTCDLQVATTVADVYAATATRAFDAVLLDIRLGSNAEQGLELLAQLRTQMPGARIAVLTGSHAPHVIRSAARFNAVYIRKPVTIDVIAAFVSRVAPVLRKPVVDRVLDRVQALRETAKLTTAETEVLLCSAFGETRSEIVDRLGITDASLRKRVSALLTKLTSVGVDAPSLDRVVSTLFVEASLSDLDV